MKMLELLKQRKATGK